MLITKIKAAHVQHLTDARYFAAWYADYLGFSLDPQSDTAVTHKQLQDIRGWVAGVAIVGEFGFGQSSAEIIAAATELELNYIQLPPFYELQQAQEIAQSGCPILKEIHHSSPADTFEQAKTWKGTAQLFVLHADDLDLEFLADFTSQYGTILASDFVAEQIPALIDRLPLLHGLQLAGGEEERVGVKSFDQLDAIFEQLED